MAKKHVLIDIRALLTDHISGVTVYIENLLEAFSKDKSNTYTLFCNSYKKKSFKKWEKHFEVIYTRIPNKIFNISLKSGRPRIDKFIDKKVDILLCPDIRPTAYSKDVKKIQILHDFSWLKHKNFFSTKTRLWFKLINPKNEILKSDHIVTVSKAIEEELKTTYKQKPKSTHIQPFIKKIRTTKSTSNKKSDFFFYIGTLEPRKNIQKMLEGFKILKKKNKNIKLYIAGEKDKKVFKNIKNKKQEGVKWLGKISETEKEKYLNKAIALIYVSEYEGFGLPVAESIIHLTPCILSEDPALKELGENTSLYANSPKEIAEKMETMITNKELYKKLQNNCILKSKQLTTIETLNKWLNLFNNL